MPSAEACRASPVREPPERESRARSRGGPGRRHFAAVALLALAAYGWFLIRHTAFCVGGSDSSGYINTARRLASGKLVERPRSLARLALPDELAQIFIPLGFMTGPKPGTMAPFYPVGFPAHLFAAAAAIGWDRGPYLVSPVAGILCIGFLYLIGRELGLSPAWSLAPPTLLAAWPVFIFQAIQPMSDVAAAFWCLATVLCSLRARRETSWAVPAGAAFGIAVLVRPTNALLAIPLLFALPLTPGVLALFGVGGLPFAGLLALYDARCYGGPLRTGYGRTGHLTAIALGNFPPRLLYYGSWLVKTLTPLVPAAWLGLAADRRASPRARALLFSWFGVFLVAYCLYGPYESFGFVRFLLPGAPGLLLGAVVSVRDLSGALPWPRAARAIAAVALLVTLRFEWRSVRSVGVLHVAESESVYPRVCLRASRELPERSVVLSMQVSGSLEYYTRLAYARWDWLDPERFAKLRPATEKKGYRWFALLYPFEQEEIAKHTPGRWKKIWTVRGVSLFALEP